MDSILTSVKKMLGIAEEYEHFDIDIIKHINSVFMILAQLGVGPSSGFAIRDASSLWSDFIPEGDLRFEAVTSYMYQKVKLMFDPPPGSAMIQAMNQSISELEFRLGIAAESTIS